MSRRRGAAPGVAVIGLLAGLVCAGALRAQEPLPEPLPPRAVPAEAGRDDEGAVSTRAAFIGSLVVPGWGHAMTGSYLRGGFWTAAQGGIYYMLWKSLSRRGDARRSRSLEVELAVERYRAEGVADPDSLRFLAERDDAVAQWDTLVGRRDDQVEDWIAVGAFVLLLGAVDAFVAAHLMDFPEPLSLELAPPPGGFDPARPGLEVRVSVPAERLRGFLLRRRFP